MAIDAGVDMFIFRNSDDYTLQLIENLINEINNNNELMQKVIKSNERILKLKQRSGIL
jgi:beta-glucosidase-like glycosyl hydrolase